MALKLSAKLFSLTPNEVRELMGMSLNYFDVESEKKPRETLQKFWDDVEVTVDSQWDNNFNKLEKK